MHRSAAFVALALVLPLLAAGCLEGAVLGAIFGGDDEASARDLLRTAERTARAWDPAAALVGAFTMETREPEFGMALNASADPSVGNGKAPAWVYQFRDAAGNGLTLVLAANGTETLREEEREEEDDDLPVGRFVDSTDAVDAARRNRTFAEALAAPRALGLALDANESGPHWALFTIGPRSVVAIVDASSGDLVGMHDMSGWMRGFGDWSGEGSWSGGGNWSSSWSGTWSTGWGSKGQKLHEEERSGTLTPAERSVDERFTLPQGARTLTLRLAYDRRVPTDAVELVLLDASGKEVRRVSGEDSGATVGRPTLEREYLVSPGAYTARVSATGTTAVAEYELEIQAWGG